MNLRLEQNGISIIDIPVTLEIHDGRPTLCIGTRVKIAVSKDDKEGLNEWKIKYYMSEFFGFDLIHESVAESTDIKRIVNDGILNMSRFKQYELDIDDQTGKMAVVPNSELVGANYKVRPDGVKLYDGKDKG